MLEIVIEFTIEINMEQTWLWQSTLFHYLDCLTSFVIEIVTDFSERAMLLLKNSD